MRPLLRAIRQRGRGRGRFVVRQATGEPNEWGRRSGMRPRSDARSRHRVVADRNGLYAQGKTENEKPQYNE